MKALAYRDNADPRGILYHYPLEYGDNLMRPKRHDRDLFLLDDIKHVGNISVYLIKGNKIRFLFSRGY